MRYVDYNPHLPDHQHAPLFELKTVETKEGLATTLEPVPEERRAEADAVPFYFLVRLEGGE